MLYEFRLGPDRMPPTELFSDCPILVRSNLNMPIIIEGLDRELASDTKSKQLSRSHVSVLRMLQIVILVL